MSATSVTRAGRAAAERIMLAECVIFRADPDVADDWDPVEGDVTELVPGEEIYRGKCQLRQPSPADQAETSGGFVWTIQDSILKVPVSVVGVRLKDMVTITESPENPGDVGAVFEIARIPRGSFITARRFTVREAPR